MIKNFVKRRIFPFYLLLILWLGLQIFLFIWTFLSIQHRTTLAPYRQIMGAGLAVAKSSAALINLNSAFLVLCMCRVSIEYLQWISFFPWEYLLTMHKVAAVGVFLATVVHVIAHYVNFIRLTKSVEGRDLGKLLFASGVGITGHFLILVLIIIAGSSISKRIREWKFGVFLYLHQVLFVLYVFILTLHGTFCFIKTNNNNDDDDAEGRATCSKATFWRWIIGPVVLWWLEKMYRWIRAVFIYKRVKIIKVIAHPSQVLEIQMSWPRRGFWFNPGQFVYLKCPSISCWQWHPFTLTTVPQDQQLGIHFRVCGNWTRQMAEACGVSFLPDGTIECLAVKHLPSILVDGPFGNFCHPLSRYEYLLLIGAGIGQTPFAAVLKFLLTQNTRAKRIFFVGICPDPHSYEWFHEFSREVEEADDRFSFRFYFTRPLSTQQIAHLYVSLEEQQLDPVTKLHTLTRFGRPKWSELFDEVALKCFGDKQPQRIGLFYCGPHTLGNVIKKESRRGGFEYHREKFN